MDTCNIGRRAAGAIPTMSRSSAPSCSSSGEHGRKGAFVAFGNTEAFYRNMVVGHGPYCEEGEGRVYRAPCGGGRGKEEPLSAIAMVLQAAPGDDDYLTASRSPSAHLRCSMFDDSNP